MLEYKKLPTHFTIIIRDENPGVYYWEAADALPGTQTSVYTCFP